MFHRNKDEGAVVLSIFMKNMNGYKFFEIIYCLKCTFLFHCLDF